MLGLFTLPPAVILLFSWYAGWNNSFNKSYEQAVVGPLSCLFGRFLVHACDVVCTDGPDPPGGNRRLAAILPVQTCMGNNLPLPACLLGVAICYVIFSIPVSVLKTMPYFLAHLKPEIDAMTDAQLVQLFNSFYLRTGLLGFPCFAFSGFWRRASMPAAWCV